MLKKESNQNSDQAETIIEKQKGRGGEQGGCLRKVQVGGTGGAGDLE
ncbi:hypothetical protein [Bartonella grahamii]|nr:hypothetical protein [Bartonella grahamii]